MKRLLITGAAGRIGSAMRARLGHLAEVLRLSDIAPLAPAGAGEECVQCDLADRAAVRDLVAGCDGIVHLGGVPNERSFESILASNIAGAFNLYEAARAHGHPRILLASSNHVAGFYRQDQRLGPDAPLRPDTLYGVSKCFTEHLARMYFDKFGQESALVRIGTCFAEPMNYRALSTWLSFDDLAQLAGRVFAVPRLGCPVIWGVSRNSTGWWDNSHLEWLGWHPRDSADAWRGEIEARGVPAADDPQVVWQGGAFCLEDIPDR